jgi:hypothetical protein
MTREEEKQEETPVVERHDETEYEDAVEVANDGGPGMEPLCACEDDPDKPREGADSADDSCPTDSNGDPQQKDSHLPADAPWTSRMWEGAFDVGRAPR